MAEPKLVIFDWDGTLMDSVGKIVNSVQLAAQWCNLTVPTAHQAKQIIGLSLDVAFAQLFPLASPDQRQMLSVNYKDIYLNHDKTATPLFAGALELCADLREQGYLLAVATGKARQGLNRMFELTNTGHLFHTSRCADEAHSKPDPQMLAQILTELDVPANQAIMVGDTIHDLAMAQAIGMPRVGVTHGVHGRLELMPYQPFAVIDQLADFLPLLHNNQAVKQA